MLYEILKHIRNFFPDAEKAKEATFTISNNGISPSFTIADGQYFLIENSALNDGVYCNDGLAVLKDETFRGRITPLKIPSDFLALVAEIESYQQNEKASPYVSESFGGYSYSKATTASGHVASWQNAFGTRLNSWRKI